MKKRTQLLFTAKELKGILFVMALLFWSSIAMAHQSGCKHHHDGSWDTSIDCDSPGDACNHDGVRGTCKTKIAWNYRDCVCTAKKKKKQIFEIGNMAAVIDNVPVEFGHTILTFVSNEETVYSIWDGVNASADMQHDFINGQMHLTFGSFDNPTRVPVYIKDMNFTISEYTFEGEYSSENTYELNDSGNRNFLYDAEKGYLFVESYDDNLHLSLTNAIVGKTDVIYAMEAFIYSDSKTAKLRVQGVYDAVGLSANASSTSSLGLLMTLALMGMVLFGFSYSFKKKIS